MAICLAEFESVYVPKPPSRCYNYYLCLETTDGVINLKIPRNIEINIERKFIRSSLMGQANPCPLPLTYDIIIYFSLDIKTSILNKTLLLEFSDDLEIKRFYLYLKKFFIPQYDWRFPYFKIKTIDEFGFTIREICLNKFYQRSGEIRKTALDKYGHSEFDDYIKLVGSCDFFVQKDMYEK